MDIGHNTDTNDIEHLCDDGRIDYRPLLVRYIIPLIVITLIGVLWLGDFIHFPSRGESEDAGHTMVTSGIRYKGSFRKDFNDLNDLQLQAAERIGIPPLDSRETLDDVIGKLREVTSNDKIHVDPLTHSVPYLVPKAHALLNEIGRRFVDQLKDNNLPLYRPIVTSITRTKQDVKRLQRGNVNATDHSTHLYGTTFDITWRRYKKVDPDEPRVLSPDELKHILAIVLSDLRLDGRCYIKHEVKQACFHITTRP